MGVSNRQIQQSQPLTLHRRYQRTVNKIQFRLSIILENNITL
jgi:hypothetical protein